MNQLEKLLDVLNKLDDRKIFYGLSRVRAEAIMVEVALPGERWELEFLGDGEVEVEVFGRPATSLRATMHSIACSRKPATEEV